MPAAQKRGKNAGRRPADHRSSRMVRSRRSALRGGIGEPKPSIGRIVHFVAESGDHFPATIIRIYRTGMITLMVFSDVPAGCVVRHAVPDQNAKLPGSWHWPEPA
jgi:hypothetical protein